MSKIAYLNSHLEKFREKSEIKIELDDLRGLAHYSNINSEDKKTTKIFIHNIIFFCSYKKYKL